MAWNKPVRFFGPGMEYNKMSRNNQFPPLVSIVGKSDSGKTTFIEKLVPQLVRLGCRVGTVKHDVHGFDIDHPGKDS